MPKSFVLDKKLFKKERKLKGQWFLISAVIISGALLALSILFRGYFEVDTSEIALLDEKFYFWNIKEGLEDTINTSSSQDLERNLEEFVYFSKQRMADKGYLLDIKYKIVDPATKSVEIYLILIQSDKMQVWEGERPEIDHIDPSFTGDTLNSVTLHLKHSVNFDISGKLDLYNSTSQLIAIGSFKIEKGFTSDTVDFNQPITNPYLIVNSHLISGKKLFYL